MIASQLVLRIWSPNHRSVIQLTDVRPGRMSLVGGLPDWVCASRVSVRRVRLGSINEACGWAETVRTANSVDLSSVFHVTYLRSADPQDMT
jgi:hypothetical protein